MSVSRVRLEFGDPAAGWLRGVLTLGDERLPVLASFLVDTPTQLVEGVVRVWEGRVSDVVWVYEPDSVVWRLAPAGEEDVRLTVGECRGISVPPSWEPGGDSWVVPRRRLAAAVVRGMDGLAQRLPGSAYESRGTWGHPFPGRPVAELRRRVRAARGSVGRRP